jgi:2'-5' RNA ligase
MPYAIVMQIEETATPRLTMLWEILANKDADGQVKFSDEQVRFNYPPHVTLSVVNDEAEPDFLVNTLKRITAGWAPLPASFDSITVLSRKSGVPILARPTVTTGFLKLNKEICDAFPTHFIKSYHRPGTWQPHVTLARDIPAEKCGDALAAILKIWDSFDTILDRVALLYLRNEGKDWYLRELWRTTLL